MSKKNLSTIILILFLVCQVTLSVFHADNAYGFGSSYSNQLLKLDIEKDSGGYNFVIYSSKPYHLNISPVKKDNNEYIIFLPETFHSITDLPDVSFFSDIKNIDIKLIPYAGDQINNGYTKIIIKTTKDIDINVKNDAAAQKNDLNSELSQLIFDNTREKIAVKPVVKKRNTVTNPIKNQRTTVNKKETNNLVAALLQPKQPTVKPNKTMISVTVKKTATTSVNKPKIAYLNNSNKKPEPIIKQENQTVAKVVDVKKAIPVQQISVNKSDKKVELTQEKAFEPATQQIVQPKDEKKDKKADNQKPKEATALTNIKLTHPTPVSPSLIIKILPFILGIVLAVIFLRIRKIRKNKAALPEQTVETENIQGITEEESEETQEQLQEESSLTPVLEATQFNQPVILQPIKLESTVVIKEEPLSTSNTMSNPINTKFEVIDRFEIDDNKGIYLVKVQNETALIGAIGDKSFTLQTFDRIPAGKLSVKKTKGEDFREIYFVITGKWQGLVGVDENSIELDFVF